ncbi:methylamine utilization protein [Pseudoalteromonas sp. MMG013]|uniref:methylamine utilization protein n=1 Tax=unclassified Pseudoalteromonas TaxID=194690 RepID=UPI001B36FD04|nr:MULTISPECIES: methylamine utilization protein [unclassified Pseudoalteromonas]MBQ4850588.1 methylamine utilization protein [Pseudoalteromonas sp. MMG012]MBQ4863934.1 methylamine utilization protein [Pseudoalteromonas sp. MMG013]
MKKFIGLLCWLGFSCQALELTVKDTQGQPLVGAAVWLEGKQWSVNDISLSQQYNMGQKDRNFTPHALIVPQGAKVDFPNFDSILHHVYSFSEPKAFELKLYRDKPQAPITFSQTGVVELGCNIHDWMLGYILVVNSGVFGLTDINGKVNLPVMENQLGTTTLQVWHERYENLDKPESKQLNIVQTNQKIQYQLQQPLLDKLDFLTDETDGYE